MGGGLHLWCGRNLTWCLDPRVLTQGKGAAKGGAADGKAELAGSESLGVDSLLQLLKNYARNADMKTAITVGGRTPQ